MPTLVDNTKVMDPNILTVVLHLNIPTHTDSTLHVKTSIGCLIL